MNTIGYLSLYLLFVWKVCSAQKRTFDNGCTVVRTPNNITSMHQPFELKAPYLNCTHLGKSTIDLTGIPTDVVSISFAFNELTLFKAGDLLNFTSLERLNLAHNKLESIVPPTNATFKSVSSVSVANNKFGKVPKEIWTIFPNVASADLTQNEISELKEDDFDNAGKLSFLLLGLNQLKQISNTAFQPVSLTLFALDLSYCSLTDVPKAVSVLPHVTFLILSNNEITHIHKNAMMNSTSLRWLMLSANKIRWIEPMALAGANMLQFIDLTDNHLETLPAGVFDGVNEESAVAVVVELYENPLRCNSSLRWLKEWEQNTPFADIKYKCAQPLCNHDRKSYELKVSDFSCPSGDQDWVEKCSSTGGDVQPTPTLNPAKGSETCPKMCICYDESGKQYYPQQEDDAIAAGRVVRRLWWRGLTKYPQVDCTDAGLTQLPDNIPLDVKTLRMENNKLGPLKITDLKRFESLEVLDLENTSLSSIIPDDATTFNNLSALLLQNNDLTVLSKEHLKSFPNLKVLRINNNQIQDIPKDIFANNKHLIRVYIGPNPVVTFDPTSLDGLDLVAMSLRNMSLSKIPHLKLANLAYLDMSDNNITIIPNNTFAETPKIHRITLDNNRIHTIELLAFKGATELHSLDLSENKIVYLPQGVFDDLGTERLRIELWMNRMYCDCNMKWFKQWIEELETEDPMTEIRFMCFRPWRIHGRVSDQLSSADFTCESNDQKSRPDKNNKEVEEEYFEYEHGTCYTGGSLALAIFLTMICTLLCCAILKWYCVRRKHHSRYKRPNELTQLDEDM